MSGSCIPAWLCPLILVAACFVADVHACSGSGHGYGVTGLGRPPLSPSWTSESEASAKVAKNGGAVIVYALQGDKNTISMWDDKLVALSKAIPFVQVKGEEAEDLARKWKLQQRPAIAITDRDGIVLYACCVQVTPTRVKRAIEEAQRKATLRTGSETAITAK
jgi:hypothetical protein